MGRQIKALFNKCRREPNQLFYADGIVMRRRDRHHVQRTAQHGIHAVRENHNIRIQNIIPGLNASDAIAFTYQSVDPYTWDKLRASLLRLRH